MIVPEHIKEYSFEINKSDTFNKIKDIYSDKYSFVYKIVCTCGCHDFYIYIDDHPTALAECAKCKKKITLYDLALYPNAIKLSNKFEMKKFQTDRGSDVFELCVLYEYSDEFEFSNKNFDVNDITAFSLFAFDYDTKEIISVLDDETAWKIRHKVLDNNNAVYVSEIRGTKREMHYWQHEKILDYMYVTDQHPLLNKSLW